MALFKLGGGKRGKNHEKAMKVISELKDHPEFMRVEIENTPHQFYSNSKVRSGSCVLTIPVAIQHHMDDGGWVRVELNQGANEDLRIQVANQERLEWGNSAKIFCRLPTASIEPRRRSAPRYFTGHFSDLSVKIGSMGSFRVLDISRGGVRIECDSNNVSFPVGQSLEGENIIRMGTVINVAFKSLVPRFQSGQWAGLAYTASDKRSEKILAVFLDSLDQKIREESWKGDD